MTTRQKPIPKYVRDLIAYHDYAKDHHCPACKGTGKVEDRWCQACGASGIARRVVVEKRT